MNQIPIDDLRKIVRLDAATGKLYWLERPATMFKCQADANKWNTKWPGKPALDNDLFGYKIGKIFNCSYRAHRVVWALVHGEWPNEIDHINHNRSDNRPENLRNVTRKSNNKNISSNGANTSGRMGVAWSKVSGRWRAYIMVSGRQRHLGLFHAFEDACNARMLAEARYGYHPNHGKGRG